jgi:glycosyltransferase involved in cell wall biosynthesis
MNQKVQSTDTSVDLTCEERLTLDCQKSKGRQQKVQEKEYPMEESPVVNYQVPEWSVIVITRNEERHIEACLQSVFYALRGRSSEVILVDSASTDRTLEIVRQFPVRIVQLPEDVPLRPSAGRHVGFQLAQGKWLLFMDGDSILDPDWIDPALEALQDPQLGGVAGIREAVLVPGDGREVQVRNQYPEDEVDYANPGFLGGPALYRREVLEKVGGFNPFLYAYEEAELGGRIYAEGYSLRRLKIRMTQHIIEARQETLADLFRRVRRGFPYGMGQLIRYGMKHKCLGRHHFANVDRHLGFLSIMLLGGVGLMQWITWEHSTLLKGWLLLIMAGFLFFCYRTRSIRKPVYYLIEWAIVSPMAVYGFFLRPRAASEYPCIHRSEVFCPSSPGE